MSDVRAWSRAAVRQSAARLTQIVYRFADSQLNAKSGQCPPDLVASLTSAQDLVDTGKKHWPDHWMIHPCPHIDGGIAVHSDRFPCQDHKIHACDRDGSTACRRCGHLEEFSLHHPSSITYHRYEP